MKRLHVAICIFIALLSFAAPNTHAQSAPRVVVATVDGPIVSVVYDYLNRAITNAEQDGASAFVLQLNTPGGEVGTTLRIIQRFAASRVPIVVYVWPRRAQAASAGTLITLGAHLAAMAPETVIGAATPISGSGADLNNDARRKAISDLRSTMRTLTRNRPQSAQDWADKAITIAESTTDEQALQLGVIDLIANDVPDLLKHIDGRNVKVGDADAKLQTANASTSSSDMSIGESLLYILVSPDIATLLLFVAISGLMIEFQAPGTIVGGVVGAIALVLFLYSVGTLPVNVAGFVFIALAVILFMLDLHAAQHGALTLGGMASFVIGALILFEPSYVPISLGLLLGLMAALGVLFLFVFRKSYQARRLKPVTGMQGLIGRTATARTELDPNDLVFVEGERWEATSEGGPIHAGERTIITALDGLRVRVKKAE